MKSIRFHAEAELELLEHEAWYRQRSDVAAQGFCLSSSMQLPPLVKRPSGGQLVGEASIATLFRAIHSPFFIAFVGTTCSSPQSRIKAAVQAIGITARSHRPTPRRTGRGPAGYHLEGPVSWPAGPRR